MMHKNFIKFKSAVRVVIVLIFAMFFLTAAICNAADGVLQVTLEKSDQNPMVGTLVYLFSESGSYLGQSQATDSDGKVEFNLSDGIYKLRVDYLGYQFWSPVYTVTGNLSETFTIAHEDVTLTVQGDYPSIEPIAGIPVYLFNEAGSYLNQNQTTDANGQVVFNLPEQSYKVRADYMGQQFWSVPFVWQDTTVTAPMAEAEITVISAGVPVEAVNLYVFTASGSYLSLNGATDTNGKVTFPLAAGDYKFRADYQGNQYWSNPTTLTAGQLNIVDISTGGGGFTFTVIKGPGEPLTGVSCYVFSESGSYLSMNGATDIDGLVSFNLADGAYKLRVDYLGYQFWSPVYTVTGNLSETFTIAHEDVTLTVQGDYPSIEPIAGIPVYLFNEAGSYLNQNQTTDANGQVVFNLPEQSYKVRAGYMGQQFWSVPFVWQDTEVTAPMAEAEITVTSAGVPVEAVNLYVFTASGSYLSLNGATDTNGKITFPLAAGDYKFRADYQGSQYWSNPTTLTAGQLNIVDISTGGGGFTFTVIKGPGVPLTGVSCYVFSESGSYLSMNGATDIDGLVSFNLADGAYKLRVDYLGYQFWSPVYTVTGNLSETFTIAHEDVTLTVQGDYPSIEPIAGIPVYLFNETVSYLSQNQTTDANGQVVFNLPEQSYKVRADYMGQQFWSDAFTWQNTTVTTNQGMAAIHVVRSGSDVPGAEVYLFSDASAYLGRHQTTDESGKAGFLLPNTSFKFRIDEGGNQHWSPLITIQAGTVNNLEVDISLIIVNIGADPENIQSGESSTLTWNSTGAMTCVIEPDIGTLDVNGSTQVSPEITTTYAVTATGPSGTATDSVTITVTPPFFSETKLTANDASDFSSFGEAVSIYGDTAIVGAPFTVIDGVESGAAYIFKYNGSVWVEQAKLVAADGEDWDSFGWSVSIYGDTAIVGADYANSEEGAAYVFHREGSLWTQQGKLTPNDSEPWNYFGGSVSIYGDYAIIGAEGGYSVEISTGAAYIFKRDGSSWTQQAKLAPSNGKFDGIFGYSVSMYEDYAIVGGGVNFKDTEDANCAAYIFKRNGSSWVEQDTLFVESLSNEESPSSVSIYKDYAIVGTADGVHGGIYQGAAFIFKRDGSVWDQQAKLTVSDPAEKNNFGSSVAIYENYAVVGAYGNRENGSYIGAAYIFKQENSVWSEQAKLTASDADQWPICDDPWGECSGYGVAVALHGGNAVIGAPGVATKGIISGAAYVYSIPAMDVELNADPGSIILGESSTLSWNSVQAISCVIEPGIGPVDVNGSITVSPDGTTTYTITATGPSGTATDSVIVNVVNPSVHPTVSINVAPTSIKWGRAALLSWDSTNANSVTIDPGIGNVDPNGSLAVLPTETTTYTISAAGPAGTATESVTLTVTPPVPTASIITSGSSVLPGESYLLTWNSSHADSCIIEPGIGIVDLNGTIRLSSETTKSYTLTATGPGGAATATRTIIVRPPPPDEFENKPFLWDNGDSLGHSVSISGNTAIAGRPGNDDGSSSGSAYIFTYEYGTWKKDTSIWADDSAKGDKFGHSVSISGDTAIVGAPGDDDDGSSSGSAYIFIFNGFDWVEQAKLTAWDAQEGDLFGYSVGISGDTAIVGAVGDDMTGSVYFFRRVGTSWKQMSGNYTANDTAGIESFGRSVSISGDTAIVGANGGAVYIFNSDGGWYQAAKIAAPDAAEDHNFGCSVSVSGSTVIVGTIGEGAAYIFTRSGGAWREQTRLTAGDETGSIYFGSSVSIDGEYAIVGDYLNNEAGMDSGAAYIFKRDGETWSQKQRIIPSDISSFDKFGHSVSISNGYVIVSTHFGLGNHGDIYMYKLFPPILNIKSNPEVIEIGGSSTLSWSAVNAETVRIDQGIGLVPAEGSQTVSPQETTTYTILASDSAGTTDKVTVTVIDPSVPPTVSITATPDTFRLGETFTLAWSAINANYCIIEPGIGRVDLSGSMTVTPGAIKTYTIIAFGPAGTVTNSVVVNAIHPTVPPTVEISSNPDAVPFGRPASLIWHSVNAYSCVIEPDIGRVDLNGSMILSLTATTTYTITAIGYAGSTTRSATVTVYPLPTVSFSANPLSIEVGGSATLTWDSVHADTCEIAPNIGGVGTSGSLQVSPDETTMYTITARGLGGKVSESLTVEEIPPVALEITSPVHMQNISRPDIMVEGTISNYLGNETGVRVNGKVAMVYNNHFVANHVPLQEGENTIAVTGTDSQGYITTTEITVYADTTEDHISITADTESGVSPFETTLGVEGTFTLEQEPVITPAGPDDVFPLESLGNAQYQIGMTTPGIYYFTAQATDEQSNTHTDTIALVVSDQGQLDALLKARWNKMKTAMINGDIDGILTCFATGTKDNYQYIFSVLTEDRLQEIASGMREIEKIYLEEDRAKYGINREKTVQGVLHDITYIIYFVKDGDGLWKIESF